MELDQLSEDTINKIADKVIEKMAKKLAKKTPKRKGKILKQPNLNSPGGKLAQFMLDKIEENDPSFATPEMGKWAACFNKMIFMETYDENEIKEVINFGVSDSFWKAVIVNPYVLRAKYYQIKTRMLNPLNKNQTMEEKRNVFEEAKRKHNEN